ncbi:Motile sperm domain-containing protein 2 [Mortierella sp. AM989]|nr:Motile sperm domain-containing protein 2 [Mortierella sp. AM989]
MSTSASQITSTGIPVPALLRISPQTFQFTASKVSSGLVSKLKIKNLLQTHVGYKFKTNAPLRYSVKPVLGVLAPGQSIEVFVRCESWVNPQDRFLLQSVSLGEEESQQIDAVSWKEIDRRRIMENLIQCTSSSTLSMRDPQDDGGSISSSSMTSSTTSSVVSSSISTQSDRAHQQRSYHQLNGQRPVVAHVHAASRKMSTSSATSSTSSPGSYPTLFSSKRAAGTLSSNGKGSTKIGGETTGSVPMALLSVPLGYLATKLSNSKQTIKTVSCFLAVRHYTKMQVFTVSVICLLLGLLLPLEKIFFILDGSTDSTISSTQFRSGAVVGHKAAVFSSTSQSAQPITVAASQTGFAESEGEKWPQETRQDEKIVSPINVEGAL